MSARAAIYPTPAHDLEDVERVFQHAAPRDQIDELVERLEGWKFGAVNRALSGASPAAIPVTAMEQRVDELREEFKRAALPVDFKSAVPLENVIAELDKRRFVPQLRKIEIGPKPIESAIGGYCRASELDKPPFACPCRQQRQ